MPHEFEIKTAIVSDIFIVLISIHNIYWFDHDDIVVIHLYIIAIYSNIPDTFVM